MIRDDENWQLMMQIEELMSKLINCSCGHFNAYIQTWQFSWCWYISLKYLTIQYWREIFNVWKIFAKSSAIYLQSNFWGGEIGHLVVGVFLRKCIVKCFFCTVAVFLPSNNKVRRERFLWSGNSSVKPDYAQAVCIFSKIFFWKCFFSKVYLSKCVFFKSVFFF